MKRTKSMIYVESVAADNLLGFIENNETSYNNIEVAVKSLKRKASKGIYEKEKATMLYFHVVTHCAKILEKQNNWKFTVTERWTVAEDLERIYSEEVFA